MKNNLIIALSVFLVILLILRSIEDKPVEIIDNSHLFNKVDSLALEYVTIKANAEQWEKLYKEQKERKDSIKTVIKTKYITIYDSTSNDSIECLPKVHVDSLIESYEYVLSVADSTISLKSSQIANLEERIELKDTIIENYETNEKEIIKALKKEKRNKWKWGVGGLGLGYLFGKAF